MPFNYNIFFSSFNSWKKTLGAGNREKISFPTITHRRGAGRPEGPKGQKAPLAKAKNQQET